MNNRRMPWVILCGLIAPGAPASAGGISGTYVGKDSNAAVLIQLVETAGGQLTGHYERFVLQPDGKLYDVNAAITGAADGQTVVVTIKPSEFFSGSLAASGTIQGHMLHLTGGGNGNSLTLDLVQSDETDFRAQVAMLTEQARKINEARIRIDEARIRQEAAQQQAKIEADQLTHLQSLTREMDVFSGKADTLLLQFGPAEQRCRIITARMRAALAREQSIYGGGQASYARNQIAYAINQASNDANQFHTSVQALQQDFTLNSNALLRDSLSVGLSCHGAHVATVADPIPRGKEALNSACLRFLDVAKKFQERVSTLRAAFAHIEGVWNAERRDQEQIVQASNVAVQ